eukprot:jgi/Psemu1/7045/gm1.7045_g
MKGINTTVPEIEGDGFEPLLIDWCSEKLISADVAGSLHPLLTNIMLVKEDNLSFPHTEDPMLPVHHPELKGNIDIDELRHGKWWIDTLEKRCNKDKNEILIPIILYMDGIEMDYSGQMTLTPLNIALGIFNTLTWNSWQGAWKTIFFHPTGTRDKGDESINNVNNLHSGLCAVISSLKDACYTPQHDHLCGHYQTANNL